jgi:hypothetical protein
VSKSTPGKAVLCYIDDIGSFLINGQVGLLLSLIGSDNLSEQLQSFWSLGLRHLVGGSLEDHE